jgi:hypothetical protein
MVYKFEIQLTEKKTGTQTIVSAEFPPEEVQAFEAYYRYEEDLSTVKFLKDGASVALNVNYLDGIGTSFTAQLPPEEDIIVLLHKLRPLILNDEHGSYNKITGFIGRRFTDANVRSFLRHQRELYDGRSMQRNFQVQAGGIVINSENVLQDWLNAFEYHRDQDKRKALETLHTLLPLPASRALFLMLLSDKASAIFNIGYFIGTLLGKTATLEFTLTTLSTSSALALFPSSRPNT